MSEAKPLTLVYKTLRESSLNEGSDPVLLDLYLPTKRRSASSENLGALVYFHGGGLTVGNRTSWFPSWLHKRTLAAGHIFISPDYRLIPSGSTTAHEILEDINDVFSYLIGSEITKHLQQCRIDPNRIAVAGSSAGGLCAYLAAGHTQPRPVALLSLYGMGGNFCTPHYYAEKKTVFFRGRELLDPQNFTEYLVPAFAQASAVTDSPNTYCPPDSPTPGYPSNPRMFLSRLYLQLGLYLDYYTGDHDPSLSTIIRNAAQEDDLDPLALHWKLLNLIPDKHRSLFPSNYVSPSWPPSFFFHGAEDSAVPITESQFLYEALRKEGVVADMLVADGMEHSFDYQPDAEELHRESFDRIAAFLDRYLAPIS